MKLFSMETKQEDNTLFIDKFLSSTEKKNNDDKDSIVANILRQREKILKEIENSSTSSASKSDKKESSDATNNSTEDKQKDQPDDKNNENNETIDENSIEKDLSSIDDSLEKDTSKDDASLDKNDKEDKDDKKVDTKEKTDSSNDKNESDKVSKESISLYSSKNTIFKSIIDRYNEYLISMSSFNIDKKISLEEQKVVYIKKDLILSLNNIIGIVNSYVNNAIKLHDNIKSTIEDYNSKIVNIKNAVNDKKYELTNAVITDINIIGNIFADNINNEIDSINAVYKYIDRSNSLVLTILESEIDDTIKALNSFDFVSEDNSVYKYKIVLPGFNNIRLYIQSYTDYINTSINDYYYIKENILNPSSINSMSAICISKETSIDNIVNKLDKLLLNLGFILDNYLTMSNNFKDINNDIKTLIYDIEHSKYANLSDINIDDRIKQIIKFKLVSDIYYVNVSILVNYINSMIYILTKSANFGNV